MSDKKRMDKKQAEGERRPRRFEAARQPRAPFALTVICVFVVLCAAVISYANSLDGELFSDNALIIKESPIVTRPGNADKVFTAAYWAMHTAQNLYRPLTIWSYRVQYLGFGSEDNPRPYHAANLIIHALNALLVFAVLARLARTARSFGEDDRLNVLFAAFGAALFATHPVATEDVANIVGRADMLAMLFLLCGLWLHMKAGGKRGGMFWHVIAGLCLLGGMLSKESAIAMVGIVAAHDILFLPPRKEEQSLPKWVLGRVKACYWFYAVMLGVWYLMRTLAVGEMSGTRVAYLDNPLAYMPFLQREATAIVMLGLYMWRTVWPVTLSADYSAEAIAPVQSIMDGRFLGTMAALAALAVIVVLTWKRSRPAAFCILVFFIAIFPVSNIALVITTMGAERLLYISLLGWAGAAAYGAVYLVSKARGRMAVAVPAACVVFGVVAVLYGYRTWVRNEDWRTEVAFWGATVETSPRSLRALDGYALAIKNARGDLEKSRELLERAIEISDRNIAAFSHLGMIYLDLAQRAGNAGKPVEMKALINRAYEVVKEGMEADRAQRAGMPGAVGDVETNATMANVCWMKGQYFRKVETNQQEARKALEEGRACAKLTVMSKPYKPTYNVQHGQILMEMAEWQTGEEGRRLREEAAVSFIRGIYFVGLEDQEAAGELWGNLGECYGLLYPTATLIETNGMQRRFVEGKAENQRLQIRALRSVILLVRAGGAVEEAGKLLDLADLYGLPRGAVQSALTDTAPPEDPRLFTGE